jgi:hypothetical protein
MTAPTTIKAIMVHLGSTSQVSHSRQRLSNPSNGSVPLHTSVDPATAGEAVEGEIGV